MAKVKTKSPLAANIFGMLGYMSVVVQWVWSAILYTPYLADTPIEDVFIPQQPVEPVQPVFHIQEPSPILVWLIVAVSLVMVVVALSAILKLPTQLGRAMQKTTQKTAQSMLPAITHGKKVSKKRQLVLTNRVVKVLKLGLVLLPLVVFLAPTPLDTSLEYSIALFVAVLCAVFSVVWFSLQYIVAKLMKIEEKQLY